MSQTMVNHQFRHTILSLIQGDITKVKADAVVSSDDNYLSMGGGVSFALSRAGGKQVAEDAQKHVPLELGDVVATTAGALQARYILHVVTIDFDRGVYAAEAHIREATLRCLKLADALAVHTLAFPALGTGSGRFSATSAADVMVRAIADYCTDETGLGQVMLVEYVDKSSYDPTDGATPGPFFTRANEMASELAQRRRFYDILDELHSMTLADPLEQDLETLKREIDNLKTNLRSIRDRAAAIHRLERSPATLEKTTLAEAPKLPGTQGIDLPTLRERLCRALSDDEVKTLAFDLQIEYENLGASTKDGMVREIISALIRRENLGQLLTWMGKRWPDST